jgi:hypothetical protein
MLGFPQLIQPRKTLDVETIAQIQGELSDPEGFSSYQEIKLWLSSCQDIEVSYFTIHKIVRYELKAKLKVPRPCHEKQVPGVIEVFKEYLPERLKGLRDDLRDKWGNNKNISYWCRSAKPGWDLEQNLVKK